MGEPNTACNSFFLNQKHFNVKDLNNADKSDNEQQDLRSVLGEFNLKPALMINIVRLKADTIDPCFHVFAISYKRDVHSFNRRTSE